jgi:hypothetical protein
VGGSKGGGSPPGLGSRAKIELWLGLESGVRFRKHNLISTCSKSSVLSISSVYLSRSLKPSRVVLLIRITTIIHCPRARNPHSGPHGAIFYFRVWCDENAHPFPSCTIKIDFSQPHSSFSSSENRITSPVPRR